MNEIELAQDERQKILENPDLVLLDKELLLALLKDSDFPDKENLIDIRNVFLKKLGEKVEKLNFDIEVITSFKFTGIYLVNTKI